MNMLHYFSHPLGTTLSSSSSVNGSFSSTINVTRQCRRLAAERTTGPAHSSLLLSTVTSMLSQPTSTSTIIRWWAVSRLQCLRFVQQGLSHLGFQHPDFQLERCGGSPLEHLLVTLEASPD